MSGKRRQAEEITELLDRKVQDLDAMCREIAQIEHENWAVIERYQAIRESIERVLEKLVHKYGGPIASEKVIQKKIEEIRSSLAPLPRRTLLGGSTVRIGVGAKLEVIRSMLEDFASARKDKVSLEDINAWFSQPRREGKEDIRDKLSLRGTRISQAQWFRANAGGKVFNLYPDDAYESKQAPYKSYFNVGRWRAWLAKNYEKLSTLFAGESPRQHQHTKKKR
jgi:hypothetical protein